MRIKLQQLRESLGVSQEKIADRIGCSISMVSRWERGRSNIPSERLPEIARAYQCSISDIFLDDEYWPFGYNHRIPIIAKIVSGSWVECGKDVSKLDHFIGRSDSTYDLNDRFGVVLEDDCMNEVFPARSLLECVSAKAFGQIPSGKKVLGITRYSYSHSVAWVKELQIENGVYRLISGSKNPMHSTEITIENLESPNKENKIIGIIVAYTIYE